MNNVILSGNLTRNPEIKDIHTKNGEDMKLARFTIACNRIGKNKGTDYPSCICFGRTAEIVEKYLQCGSKVIIRGSVQTGSYEKGGSKVYTTDISVSDIEFLPSSKSDEQAPSEPQAEQPSAQEDMNQYIPESDDVDLPFV